MHELGEAVCHMVCHLHGALLKVLRDGGALGGGGARVAQLPQRAVAHLRRAITIRVPWKRLEVVRTGCSTFAGACSDYVRAGELRCALTYTSVVSVCPGKPRQPRGSLAARSTTANLL